MNPAFTSSPSSTFRPIHYHYVGLTPRRVRPPQDVFATPRRTRPIIQLMSSRQPLSDDQHPVAPAAIHRNPEASDSYLQCVECSALYLVEPEELEGPPRVVGCSACLHEWYASDADLLWGEDEALAALAQHTSFETRSRSAKDNGQRAINAAAGIGLNANKRSADNRKEETKVEREKRKETTERRRRDSTPQSNETVTARSVESSTAQRTKPVDADKEKEEEEESRFNVFVGNLSFRATEEDLYRAFSGYGAVLKCQVPSDASGASRGYGFVEMRNRESGLKAIECLQGTSIMGRDVSLDEARPRKVFNSAKRSQGRPSWATREKGRPRDFSGRSSGDGRGATGFRKDKKQQREHAQDRLKFSKNS